MNPTGKAALATGGSTSSGSRLVESLLRKHAAVHAGVVDAGLEASLTER